MSSRRWPYAGGMACMLYRAVPTGRSSARIVHVMTNKIDSRHMVHLFSCLQIQEMVPSSSLPVALFQLLNLKYPDPSGR